MTTAEELDALPIRERDAWVAAVLRFMRERGYTVTPPGQELAVWDAEIERDRAEKAEAERDAARAALDRVRAVADLMAHGPDRSGEPPLVTQAWTHAADAIRAAVGPRDRRTFLHCGFAESHEPHADRDTYCDGSRCLAHPPTPPVDEADVEALGDLIRQYGDIIDAVEIARSLLATGRVAVTR